MAKVGSWSTTPASNNSAPPDGWPEGQAPSTVNDCARQMMADIRTLLNDLSFVDLAHVPTRTGNTTLTIPGNVTSFYEIGRRVKAFDATTLYGTITSASFTTNTGITLRLDSGVLTASLSSIAVSVIGIAGNPVPATVAPDNILINGQLDIWQRADTDVGVSSFGLSGSAASAYGPDNFQILVNGGASINASRSERSANASNVPTVAQCGVLLNHSLCISVSAADATIASSDYAQLATFIEGVDFRQIAQKPTTYSFWVKTNRTGTYCISMRNAGLDRAYVAEYSISSTSWEKKTFLIPESPSAGTWNYSSGAGMIVTNTLAAGSSYQISAGAWSTANALATSNQINFLGSAGHTIRFAAFSMVDGISDRAPRFRPYQDELLKCQRLYRTTGLLSAGQALGGQIAFSGNVTSGGVYIANTRFDPPMKSTPSISIPTGSAGSFVVGNVAVTSVNRFGLYIQNQANATGIGFFTYGYVADASF